MKRLLAFVLMCAMPLASAQAQPESATRSGAQEMTALERRAQDLIPLFNGETDPQAIFAPILLDAFPAQQMRAIGAQLTAQFGQALEIIEVSPKAGSAGVVTIRMERAVGEVSLAIIPADENRIAGLRLLEFKPIGDDAQKIRADLEALPGKVSAYFGPIEGAPGVFTLNAEEQMPLGSAMKLYVLAQLSREVAQGKRSWGDVIALDQKSFPSGQMQNWPSGAPVTLHSLASLMISISDNTATDQLIRLLGPKAMADILEDTAHTAPALNAPWLTTRELFLLKGGSSESIAAYSNGSLEDRERILASIEENPPSLTAINAALAAGPVAIDTIEWFANTSDLARLFQVMRAQSDPGAFAIMAINPGIPASSTSRWDYVGFKGGSETGVLNLTWLLRGSDVRDHILTLSWSNTEQSVSTQTLIAIAQRILSLPQ